MHFHFNHPRLWIISVWYVCLGFNSCYFYFDIQIHSAIFLGKMSLLEIKPGGSTRIIPLSVYDNWCISVNNQKLLVGDWNGDRFTDLLCHHQSGRMRILFNQAGFYYRSGTVNSKSFVCKVFLWIKWKFELIYAL